MPRFRSKPKVIDAVQFNDETNPPRGVTVSFTPNGTKHHVITAQKQVVHVKVGEWIVDEGDGVHFYPIADEVFNGPKGYEPTDFGA